MPWNAEGATKEKELSEPGFNESSSEERVGKARGHEVNVTIALDS